MPTVTGLIPLTVNFTDTSVGAVEWLWDFDVTLVGNEGTSTQRNPTHIYDQVGTFGVSLTVSNSQGSDTITEIGAVIATSTDSDPPVGNYTLSLSAGTVSGFTNSPAGTVAQGGTSPYSAGTVVYIVAEPFDTFGFMNWEGDIDGIENITAADTQVTMNGNYTIAAVFEYEGN